MAELKGRDTTGKWLDPESDGPPGSGQAKRDDRSADSGSELDDEFGGRVISGPEDGDAGAAVEPVDFGEAVSEDKADVRKVVKESRVYEVLDDIERNLVGLKAVKRRIREMAALLVIDRLRNEMGLTSERPTLHMSFTGNPGTGKTTVALRMAAILHRLGYIEKGQLVSVTRDDLVGQYVGHTAPKTKEVIKKALGGVLFIDEAYYLHRPENERDYGQEAIEVLLQVMESERHNLVVVMAGYKDRMDEFFGANPGMGSRVAHHIHFPDYSPDELLEISQMMISEQGYEFSEDAQEAMRDYIERRVDQPRFAHGRSIRNAIERARMRQAMRLFEADRELTKDELVTIEAEDIRRSSVFDDQPIPEYDADAEPEDAEPEDAEAAEAAA
ncbi:MAG TPA: CbbX protein [Solirubrobacteraceae bacterium]|nr:CbbX protein [Solirubrobacteraceae bacterium]